MFDKFTDKARKVMSLSGRLAVLWKYVGTEAPATCSHQEGRGIAAQALAKLEVSYDEALATVRAHHGRGRPCPGTATFRYSSRKTRA